MKRQQNPELLSMIGLGTVGGQTRADGSAMERGIHLRWQMGEEMGFPRRGFDLYRREQNLDLFIRCGILFIRDDGGIIWVSEQAGFAPKIEVKSSGESRPTEGCNQKPAYSILLPGRQSVEIKFKEPGRRLRIKLDGRTTPAPVATAFWRSGSGDVLVAEEQASRNQDRNWIIHLFADHIDYVILRGEGMIICEVCYVLVEDGYDLDWGQVPLNSPLPIYLPITHPDWNSPHAHAPDDQAEAEARLPVGLPAERRLNYADGFETELHDILYDLVGTEPQHLHRINESDVDSGAALAWPGMQLLKLIALDPNLARILGLYWQDNPPDPNKYYDYRLVAHYGDTPFPGRRHNYSNLVAGARYGATLDHEGLIYLSPNPIDVIQAEWDGAQMNALFIGSAIPNAPLSIKLPNRLPDVVLYVDAQSEVKAKGFLGTQRVVTEVVDPGQKIITLHDQDGIDTLILETAGGLTIFEIELRATNQMMDDIVYVSFHHRVETPPPLAAPALYPPRIVATRTGISEDGALMENQSSVGLRWTLPEAGGPYLRPGSTVLYHAQRANRGDGAQPDPGATFVLLNETAPTIVSEYRAEQEDSADMSYYTDRNLPEGWYSYQVRGIDIFGRLGEWSRIETVRALDSLPPPPPQRVTAQYLDLTDPWLSQPDKDWAEANGPGLKVGWEWPGMLRLQAPDVVPNDAEFRIYSVKGEMNSLGGVVNEVTVRGDISELATDLTWNGAQDELAGESIRVGADFFEVTGNGTGAGCAINVKNLTAPALVPEPGPCRIVFGPDRSYRIDYGKATNWEARLGVTPAVEIPVIIGHVVNVKDFADGEAAIISKAGATRTVVTDQPFTDEEGVLTPGALLCEGVVYQAYGHTTGNRLKIHITPYESAAGLGLEPIDPNPWPFATSDSADRSRRGSRPGFIEPPENAPFVYYPGRRYETYIDGFNLDVTPASGAAFAHVAVSCSDGKPHANDDPIWERPGRGGLGGRPGNEGSLSPVCKLTAVKRSLPQAVQNVPVASEPIFARPANYYGQAKYTLQWEPAPDAVGYAIYRCAGATLFDQDRNRRQNRKDYYATHEVFADDAAFSDWLAVYDPALTADDLINHPDSHLDAWRAWADRFYPALTDTEVQSLANREGNEKALRRVNKDPVQGTTYTDTFDGRGRGFYLYRVRSIDAADNLGAWSGSFPPVHIYDVTPPATPVLTATFGGERTARLEWRANTDGDLAEYRLWRSETADGLNDVRRLEPTFTLTLIDGAITATYSDGELAGPATYYYRLAAVDRSGNISEASATRAVRIADTLAPERPEWIAARRLEDAIALLVWSCSAAVDVTVERRSAGLTSWMVVAPMVKTEGKDSNTGKYLYRLKDSGLESGRDYSYRLTARAANGLTSESEIVEVDGL